MDSTHTVHLDPPMSLGSYQPTAPLEELATGGGGGGGGGDIQHYTLTWQMVGWTGGGA